MKARVKATGQPIEISDYLKIYPNPRSTCYYFLKDLKFEKDSDSPDYWTSLEHQAAIGAMHGLCANYTEFTKDNDGTLSNTEMITENARIIAHALVEKVRYEENPKELEGLKKELEALKIEKTILENKIKLLTEERK